MAGSTSIDWAGMTERKSLVADVRCSVSYFNSVALNAARRGSCFDNVYVFTQPCKAVYSQTLTALSIFKQHNVYL